MNEQPMQTRLRDALDALFRELDAGEPWPVARLWEQAGYAYAYATRVPGEGGPEIQRRIRLLLEALERTDSQRVRGEADALRRLRSGLR